MKKVLFQSFYLFLLAGIGIIISNGCKKDDNGNNPDSGNADYYISFKANGVQKKYTRDAYASLGHSSSDNLYNAVLQGYDKNTASKSTIGIAIVNNVAVTAGTYQDPQKATNAGGDKVSKVLIGYSDDAGDGYLSMGTMVDENGNPLPGLSNIVADGVVTVTKLTSDRIEGTFSGTTTLSSDATFNTKVVITEGKFILKRLQ